MKNLKTEHGEIKCNTHEWHSHNSGAKSTNYIYHLSRFFMLDFLQFTCSVLTTCLVSFKKCFQKEKGTCICTIPTSSSQITSSRYLNFPQIFVMKILKGVNEVLLHFHIQGVLYLREFPHGFPHLTKRWACKVIRKPLNVKERRRTAIAIAGLITDQTQEQLPVF